MTAKDFSAAALELVGVPFQAGGRTENGLDCSGLVVLSAHRSGHQLEQFRGFRPGSARSAAAIDAALRRLCVPVDLPCLGAIASVRIGAVRLPRHLAICVGGGRAVHADQRRGVRVAPLDSIGDGILGYWLLKL